MLLRTTLRNLVRDRAFTLIAVLMLALGIGANTAIFSLVNGVLLRSMPYPAPERLVTIAEVVPKLGQFGPTLPANARHFYEWRTHSISFDSMALSRSGAASITGSGEPIQVGIARVSASIFAVIGVQPALGRGILAEEDQPGHNRVAVLSDSLWRRQFNGDPAIIGQPIKVNGYRHTVIGVLPAAFQFPLGKEQSRLAAISPGIDVYTPLALKLEDEGWSGDFNYDVIARLKPGVRLEQARAELNVLQAGIAQKYEAGQKDELLGSVTLLQDQIVGSSRRGLMVMLAAVGAVLLIVCVNLANLLLARAVSQKRDMAVRAALGASRFDLVSRMLLESSILAFSGGVLGILSAWWVLKFLIQSAPLNIPRLDEVSIDGNVLLFALVITTATGLLFGLLPALRLIRIQPIEALRSGGRSATDSRHGMQVRRLLVAAEVALTVMLLIGAGLLLRSFVNLMSVDKGFEVDRILATDLTLPGNRYKDEKSRLPLLDRLIAKVEAVPGVKSAAIVSVLPLEGEGWGDAITVEGRQGKWTEQPLGRYRFVSPSYFRTMGVLLKQGRLLDDSDRNTRAALISESVAKRVFDGENPIGKHFRRGNPDEPWLEVVGVVGDVHTTSLSAAPPMVVYCGYWYRNRMTLTLAVRTAVEPHSMGPALRAAIHDVERDVPVGRMRTMDEILSESVGQRRFQMTLVLGFAISALLLASLGIYGVISYSVTQRRAEMGIRLALGAQKLDVHRLIIGQGLAPVIIGMAAGIAGSLAIGRVVSSLLFEVSARDPFTIAGVSLVLLMVSAAACFLPARRAADTDPAIALRYE